MIKIHWRSRSYLIRIKYYNTDCYRSLSLRIFFLFVREKTKMLGLISHLYHIRKRNYAMKKCMFLEVM